MDMRMTEREGLNMIPRFLSGQMTVRLTLGNQRRSQAKKR